MGGKMSAVYRAVVRLWAIFRKTNLDDQVREEFATSIRLATDENIRLGSDQADARREALRKFGGQDAAIELHRDARGLPLLEDFFKDLRHGVRLLGRSPIFALTATLSLAIGIGADTTIFTIANAILFRAPAGIVEPGRLVDIVSKR